MRGEVTEPVLRYIGRGEQVVEHLVVRQSVRIKAAELLGRYYSLFTEKVKVDSDMNMNITVDYGEEKD